MQKLLNQLASTEDIIVNVYDTTNASAYICMYGTDICGIGLPHISSLDFGDPMRRHEIHCRLVIVQTLVTLSPESCGIM